MPKLLLVCMAAMLCGSGCEFLPNRSEHRSGRPPLWHAASPRKVFANDITAENAHDMARALRLELDSEFDAQADAPLADE